MTKTFKEKLLDMLAANYGDDTLAGKSSTNIRIATQICSLIKEDVIKPPLDFEVSDKRRYQDGWIMGMNEQKTQSVERLEAE